MPELLPEGRAAELAGQTAWLTPSAPLVYVSPPAKSPTVLGREKTIGLWMPYKLERTADAAFLSAGTHINMLSAVNCGS